MELSRPGSYKGVSEVIMTLNKIGLSNEDNTQLQTNSDDQNFGGGMVAGL